MNKKLIAAAIAAAMVAPAAYAQATLYGKMHMSIDANDRESQDATAPNAAEDNWEVNSRSSRIGVKGSEDLGGGLKAIYQVELGLRADGGDQQTGGGVFGSNTRNTFVGLSGGFGTFLVGRHDTPQKVAFYAAGNERLGDSIIDLNRGASGAPSNLNPIGVFRELRANNTIVYISPNFSGFTLAAAAIPGEELDPGTPGTKVADGLTDHYSLGLMYKGGGLKASVGYEELDNQAFSNVFGFTTGLAPFVASPGAFETDLESLQAGASYTFGAFSVGAQWEETEVDDIAEYEAWAITGKATFGNNAISLVYTSSEADAENVGPNGLPLTIAGGSVETEGWGVAAEHNFSKRTKAYVAYVTNETEYNTQAELLNARDADDDVFSLGMIHNF